MKKILTFSLVTLLISCGGNETTDTNASGEKYQTVEIGNQIWLSENLNSEHFSNGDPIKEVTSAEEWAESFDRSEPAWCYYDFDKSNGEVYGKIYNYHAITDSRGLAPEGFRVPNDEDWNELINSVSKGVSAPKEGEINKSYNVASALKETGTEHWLYHRKGATNESGFTGLPGGSYYDKTNHASYMGSSFEGMGTEANWWSTTESSIRSAGGKYNTTYKYFRLSDNSRLDGMRTSNRHGYYVRCVKTKEQ